MKRLGNCLLRLEFSLCGSALNQGFLPLGFQSKPPRFLKQGPRVVVLGQQQLEIADVTFGESPSQKAR